MLNEKKKTRGFLFICLMIPPFRMKIAICTIEQISEWFYFFRQSRLFTFLMLLYWHLNFDNLFQTMIIGERIFNKCGCSFTIADWISHMCKQALCAFIQTAMQLKNALMYFVYCVVSASCFYRIDSHWSCRKG